LLCKHITCFSSLLQLDWDTDPGLPEIQTIQTIVYAGQSGTVKEVQQIKVTATSSIANSTQFRLKYLDHETDSIFIRPASGSCASSITEVQTITSSTVIATICCQLFTFR
jgi:hypothetical protein